MKIDGNTKVSICCENEVKKCDIEDCTLNGAIKIMSEETWLEIQAFGDYKNKITQHIIINGKKYNLKTDINIELEISILNVPLFCSGYFNQKYKVKETIELKDFYNYIAELIEVYAYELDTDMNNIKVEVNKLKILNVYQKEGEN